MKTIAELKAARERALKWYRHHTAAAAKSKRRAHTLRKKIAARENGPNAAVAWALSQVGTVEQPANSNWGPKINDWIKASGYGYPVPWCQCFANVAAVHGGAPQLRTGYTPTVLAGIGGYKPIPASQAKRGDFVFFKWPGISSAACDHVGILVDAPKNGRVNTVEGNTSPGNGGSQWNGGGVYHRQDRSTSLVAGYVRPPYPS